MSIPTPSVFDFLHGDNVQQRWTCWVREFQLYVDLAMDGKTDKTKVNMLLYLVGPKGREIYDTLQITAESKLTEVIAAFDKYICPSINETVERFKFNNRRQLPTENFETYYAAIQTMAARCSFGGLKASLLRDRIVCGVSDVKLSEKLLAEADLNLENCLKICRTHELSKTRTAEIKDSKDNTVEVDELNRRKVTLKPQNDSSGRCKYCGRRHQLGAKFCPAFGKKCTACTKPNHFAVVCKSKKLVQEVIENENYTEYQGDDSFFIDAVSNNDIKGNQAFVDIQIGERGVKMKLDTGAQVNALPLSIFKSLNCGEVDRTDAILTAYAGHKIDVAGSKVITCRHKNVIKKLLFYVVRGTVTPILGLKACMDLNLIQIIMSVNKSIPENSHPFIRFADVFEGLGAFPGECHIEVDPNVKPVIHAARTIPQSRMEPVQKELQRMEQAGVISKVTQPTAWVNSMVVVEKSNSQIRICLDPKNLNQAIQRPHYRTPTIEDITLKLKNACVFSKADARSGYWFVKLDKNSALLTTFNTPFGRFCLKGYPLVYAAVKTYSNKRWMRHLAICQEWQLSQMMS